MVYGKLQISKALPESWR